MSEVLPPGIETTVTPLAAAQLVPGENDRPDLTATCAAVGQFQSDGVFTRPSRTERELRLIIGIAPPREAVFDSALQAHLERYRR
jgi:hypothetical protein